MTRISSDMDHASYQDPIYDPFIPAPTGAICARCGKAPTIRIMFDGGMGEWRLAVSCHGEVQGVALRPTTEKWDDRTLAVSLIESIGKVFGPKEPAP